MSSRLLSMLTNPQKIWYVLILVVMTTCLSACYGTSAPEPVAGNAAATVPAIPLLVATPGATAVATSVGAPATYAPGATPTLRASAAAPKFALQEYPLPLGSGPHDVAPAADGGVWYTAQAAGELGWLNPANGATRQIKLGNGSAPHGVIVGPDGAPWITDGGLNAIVRVDPTTREVQVYHLPSGRSANLNTATFDRRGILWFTGQNGLFGRLDPASGKLDVYDAPRGPGPYGISATPQGDIYYASLAGSHIARIDPLSAVAMPLELPTPGQGARRVWPDSAGRLWVSEWNAGQVALYDPAANLWREWRLPGERPQAYAVYVDEHDLVWLTDWGANALVRFDPVRESFGVFPLPSPGASVRQLLGRAGEVWGAESGADALVVMRTR
jgi:virginiamycin B lyase